MRRQLRQVASDLQKTANELGQLLAQSGVSYRVSPIEPGDVSFTSDDWDGSDAVASYPNLDEDPSVTDFYDHAFMFVPTGDDARDAKSNWKAPFRDGPGEPVNTNALQALLAAINGARGGFDGISEDTLRDGYEKTVDLLVQAGEYESADDAPAFDPPQADASQPDDPADDGGDGADDGGDDQAQAGDQDPDPDADGGDADPDGDQVFAGVELTAQATGTVTVDPDDAPDLDDQVQAADGDGDGLVGIIWGAGNHDLGLGGEAAQVHVPPETVDPTFQALEQDVSAGEVHIGLDHAPDDSVLAQSGLREIGVAQDVAMAADGKHIVLTDSKFTSDQALKAHEQGEFQQFDFSVVADVAVRTDDDGNRVTNDQGRLVLDAVRITRIDVVQEGAVNAASVGRVPELASAAETVAAALQDPNHTSVQNAAQALQASAAALDDLQADMKDIDPTDIDNLDDARDQLDAAASLIDDLSDEKDSLEAQADAFTEIAQAHNVDPDDYDDAQAAAQAVVDEQTQDIRQEIADLEAELADYDVDDVEARASELAGQSRRDLENTLNARKAEKLEVVQAQQNKGRAATKRDQASGRDTSLSAGGAGDADADELALEAMGGRDRIEQQASDLSPSEFVAQKYGVEASDHANAGELNDAIMAADSGQGAN